MQLEDALSVGDPTGVEMSGSSVATNDSWSPAAGLVWLNDSSVSYLVAGTLQGCVCVWDVSRAVVSEGQKAATQTTALSLSSHSPPLNVGDGSSSIGDQTKSQPPSASVSSVPALRVVDLSSSETPRGPKQDAGCVVGLAVVAGASQGGVSTATNSDHDSNRDSNFPFQDLVVAATDLGVVAGIRALTGDVAFRFDTKTCGVASVAVTVRTDSIGASTIISILVGYDVGVLEMWEVAIAGSPNSSSDPTAALSPRSPSASTNDTTPPSKRKKTPAKLVVKASLESRYAIRSIVPFHRRPASPPFSDTKELANEAASPLEEAPLPTPEMVSPSALLSSSSAERCGTYVLLTLEPDRQQSTANLVEVIDLRAVQVAYEAALNNNNNNGKVPDSARSSLDTPLLLEAHRVLAGAGMELRDAGGGIVETMSDAAGRSRRLRVPWIPSSGTHRAVDLTGLQLPGKDASPWCAVGLADGTVGLVSAIEEGEDGWSWGIAAEADQLQFSYPCIGMACVSMENGTSSDEFEESERLPPNAASFLACCLRGGTTYFLPLSDGESRDNLIHTQPPTLRVVTYPNELDMDTSFVQHVQGFAAGNVRLNDRQCNSGSIPVIALAWPGGILEVFSCQLLSETASLPPSLNQSLEDTGALSELLQLLLLRGEHRHEDEDDSGGGVASGPLWSAARQEVLARFAPPQEGPSAARLDPAELPGLVPSSVVASGPQPLSLSRADLQSHSFQALRRLLLHLATEE